MAQSVTVIGVQDADASDESVVVDLDASGGDYGTVSGTATVGVDDDDSTGLLLSHTTVPVDEGDTATFTVRLATRPTADVMVAAGSRDASAVSVTAGAILTFTTSDWATARTVTVFGVQDDDPTDESVVVDLDASGGDYGTVSGTVTVGVDDDDIPALIVDPTTVHLNEGGTATFTVRLATRPATPGVGIQVVSGDPRAVSPHTSAVVLNSDDWSTAQTLTVEGIHDDDTRPRSCW